MKKNQSWPFAWLRPVGFCLPSAILLSISLVAISPLAHSAESSLIAGGASDFSVNGGAGVTLEDFFTAAINYSPKLKIAEENLNISGARQRAATGRLLPQINANANISNNRRNALDLVQEQEFDGKRYSLQLSQVLFNWQTFSARNQAKLIEDQLEAEYYYELATLLTVVAERYFNVLQAGDALESILSELDAVNNQLAQIQSMYERQLTQITDLYEALAAQAAVEAELLRLQSDLALSRESLRSATGLRVGQLFELDELASMPLLGNSIQFWVQQARSNNQQIRARQIAVQVAEERISEKRGAYMPRVSLIVQRQDSNLGFDNALISQTDSTYIGLDVSIPLFAGGSNRAGVSEAISQREIARSELRQIELEADERVRSAYLRIQNSETLTQAAIKLVEFTALSAQASQEGFSLGVVTSVDVLNALRDQYAAERDLQQTRYDHIMFLLILKREAGVLTSDDMVEIGGLLVEPDV